jgi:hypothetical protein
MEIKNVTIVARGTNGQVMRAVFDVEGKIIDGDDRLKGLLNEQIGAKIAWVDPATNGGNDDASDDSVDDSGLPNESGLGDETDGGADIDTGE